MNAWNLDPCGAADRVRRNYRKTDWGRLLVRYGYEPYDTESAARRVAEKAAAEIKALRKLVLKLSKELDHGDYPENSHHLALLDEVETTLATMRP